MAVLCIAGGGMKAITWLVAVFVSLIQDTEHDDIKTGHDVLRFVTVLSTVSAGSWFVMSLLYSDVFLNLLEDMGRVKGASEAKVIFMQRWILPLRALLKKRSMDASLKRISNRHRFLLATMKHTMGQDAAHLATALSGNITWSQVLLEAIHSNAPMMCPTEPPTPLKRMRWLVNSTLHLPSQSEDTRLTDRCSYRGQRTTPTYPCCRVPFTACVGIDASFLYECVEARPLGPYEGVTYFEDECPVATGSLAALGKGRGLVAWDDLRFVQRLVAESCHLAPLVECLPDAMRVGPWSANANNLRLLVGPSTLAIAGVSSPGSKRKRKGQATTATATTTTTTASVPSGYFESNPVLVSDGTFSDNSGVGAALRVSRGACAVLLIFDGSTIQGLFAEPLPVFDRLPDRIESFLADDQPEGNVQADGVSCQRTLYAAFGDRGLDRYGRPTPPGSARDILGRIERLRFSGLRTSNAHDWFGGRDRQRTVDLTVYRFQSNAAVWDGVAHKTHLSMSGNLDDYGWILERGLGFVSHCAILRRDLVESLRF
jgi:hypothetical protein